MVEWPRLIVNDSQMRVDDFLEIGFLDKKCINQKVDTNCFGRVMEKYWRMTTLLD